MRLGTTLEQCPKVTQLEKLPDGRPVCMNKNGDIVKFNPPRTVHGQTIVAAALSPDDRLLASATSGGSVSVSEVSGMELSGGWATGAAISRLAFHPNSQVLLVHRAASIVELWDLKTGQQITLQSLPGQRVFFDFSEDGRWVFALEPDYRGHIWDAATGRSVSGPGSIGHDVTHVAISEDGSLLAMVDGSNAVSVIQASGGRLHGGPWSQLQPVHHLAFNPQGDRLVIAGADGAAQIWPLGGGNKSPLELRHKSAVVRACFSPDGRLVVTSSTDNTARVWDAVTGQPVTPPLRHNATVREARFDAEGKRLETTSDDDIVRIWQLLPVGRFEGLPAKPGESNPPIDRGLFMLADGKAVALAEPAAGATPSPVLRHRGPIRHAGHGPDGLRIVTASDDNTAQIWDANTGAKVTPPLWHKGNVVDAEYSPDGKLLATASDDHTARVWDALTGEPLTAPFGHPCPVARAYFSADATQLITIGGDQHKRTWALTPDPRPVEDLIRQAQILAGARISNDKAVVPLDSQSLTAAWQAGPN
jgi:WD40 repeat protein